MAVWSVIALISLFGRGYLTQYIETSFVPGMIQKLGITQSELNIRGIGLSGTDAGPVRLGSPENPALVIQSIAADYSLPNLLQKKVRRITLAGVTIRCQITDTGISFPGIDMRKILSRQEEEEPAESSSATVAIPVDRFELYDGTLLVDWEAQAYRIPFELEAHAAGDDRFLVTLRMFPWGEAVVVSADMSLAENRIQLSVLSEAVQVSRFSDIIEKIPGLSLKGNIDITVNAACDLSPFDLLSVDANLAWKDFHAEYSTVSLQGPYAATPAEDVFSLHLGHEKGKAWQLTSSGLSVASPAPVTASDVVLDIIRNDEGLFAKGTVLIQNRASSASQQVKIHTPVRTTAALSADYLKSGQWHATVSNAQDGKGGQGHISAPEVDVTLGTPVFNITASGTGKADEKHISADIRVDLPNTGIRAGAMAFNLPGLSFSGHATQAGSKAPVFNGIFSLSEARFTDKESALAVKGIAATVPVSWPATASVKPGHFSAAGIRAGKFSLGSVKGVIAQKGRGLVLTGTHASKLLSGLTVDVSGEGRLPEEGGYAGHVAITIPEYRPAPELDLGRFAPSAEGLLFTGTLQGRGEVNAASSNGIDGFFELSLNDGRLMNQEGNIDVEGIYGEVRLPKLPHIESLPDRKAGFSKATFGGIVLEDGEVRYKVESPESFFIEKADFKWCSGQVETQSFRILTGIEDYDVIFYCAKLELSQVIGQVASFDAEGRGTVSGRIPLIYKNGRLAFNNGFLYSEPGVTGQIQIRDTEKLTDGVLAGTPKFAQLVIAQEALKDYEYAWAKLELNTEKENLRVRLRFDGKPARALPFRLDTKTGQLVLDDSGTYKADFDEGIGLDINTSLPINDMLKYKDMIKNKFQ